MRTEPSHNDRLRAVGTSTQACTTRILAVWARATDGDKVHGARWYTDGELFVTSLAAQTGYSIDAVAAVVAHLSPRTRWSRNQYGATMLLTTGDAPTCIGANVERARKALCSDSPLNTLNGPKTQRFARNLLGERASVTIDMWAATVALGRDDYENILNRAGVYEALEHCYRLAARKVGVDPATMQATVWIVARNGRYL